MKKLCEILGIRPFSVKEMCALALLIAVTLLLSIYATFRIGNLIKIPFKFISVFITGALFGPFPAALVALFGDILNAFLVPVGPWLPQISLIEFISGFIYGVFFYKQTTFSKSYVVRLILCVICQMLLDIFLTSLFLAQVGYFPSYTVAMITRFPASIVKLVLQSAVIALSASYLTTFKKILKK